MINATKIIGLTGNIATGKSVVRRMLENSGALGIDADLIAHRMLYPGGPAYHPVIKAFGNTILQENQHISHKKLGEIVFSNPDKLAHLEAIVHPAVTEAILLRINKARNPFVVIEAIKLLESELGAMCDLLWVSHASENHQLERLLQSRNMSEEEAKSRIHAQPPQAEKLAQADAIINTEDDFEDTWKQLQKELNDTIQSTIISERLHINISEDWTIKPASDLLPQELGAFLQTNPGEDITHFHKCLGLQMILPVFQENRLEHMIIWDNWNFTATLDRVIPANALQNTAGIVFEAFQAHSRMNQCEIMLLPDEIVGESGLNPQNYEFARRLINQLPYLAWQQAGEKKRKAHQHQIWVKIISHPIELDH